MICYSAANNGKPDIGTARFAMAVFSKPAKDSGTPDCQRRAKDDAPTAVHQFAEQTGSAWMLQALATDGAPAATYQFAKQTGLTWMSPPPPPIRNFALRAS